jgi:hypothetical protein
MVPSEIPSYCTMQITKIDPTGTQVTEFERVKPLRLQESFQCANYKPYKFLLLNSHLSKMMLRDHSWNSYIKLKYLAQIDLDGSQFKDLT